MQWISILLPDQGSVNDDAGHDFSDAQFVSLLSFFFSGLEFCCHDCGRDVISR